MKPQEHISTILKKALSDAGFASLGENEIPLEKPKQENFGDISTPIAMNLAKIAKKAPRQIAQDIVDRIEKDPFYIDNIEIAGPGFINFFLADACLQQTIHDIQQEGENYGHSQWGKGKSIQFEFVSANPTGPLNVVSARAASVGDVLVNIYNAVGYKAQREYYVNDAGRQIRLLGASLNARYLTELGQATPVPEDGYHGEYLKDLARDLIQQNGEKFLNLSEKERTGKFSELALNYMLNRHKKSMSRYGVQFDVWFRESAIRQKNEHIKVLQRLRDLGHTFEKEDAVWFKSTDYGDEKDRVLITSEGRPTYFLVDIAYHENKFSRGFDHVVDFWGPDHHGYIPRMRAALLALGHPEDSFDVSIIQQVNLLRSGRAVKMSKRAGEIVEMDELIDEVGPDAARYFFVDRRMSQPLDFDIDLAKKQSDENPVYYVQYAHARISNILRFAKESGIQLSEQGDTSLLTEQHELALIKKCLEFPEVVTRAAQTMEPHRITNYLHETATVFHRFYHEHRVVSEDKELSHARLLLCKATRQVLANGLKLLGVSAPENM